MARSCLVQQPLKGSAKGSTRHTECAGWLVALCDGAATSPGCWAGVPPARLQQRCHGSSGLGCSLHMSFPPARTVMLT